MVEKKEVRRIDPWSLGKVSAAIGLIWGIIFGILGAIAFLISSGSPEAQESMKMFSGSFFAGVGILIIVVMPVIGAIAGLLGGIISAALYNIVVKYVDGVILEFK